MGKERLEHQDGMSTRANTLGSLGGSARTGQRGGNVNLNLSHQNTTSGTTDQGFESKTKGGNFGVRGQFSDYSVDSGSYQMHGGINHNHSVTNNTGISDIRSSNLSGNAGGIGSSSGFNCLYCS